MRIEHIAIWCQDLEKMKDFYMKYFQMSSSEKYTNPIKRFNSYFLAFPGEKTRLELMHREDVTEFLLERTQMIGLTHISISVGGKEKVNEMTEQFRNDGFKIMGEPRTTGDGYYESVILDPENNQIEITE